MKNYNHLNQSKRYALEAYLSVNKSRSEISALLGACRTYNTYPKKGSQNSSFTNNFEVGGANKN